MASTHFRFALGAPFKSNLCEKEDGLGFALLTDIDITSGAVRGPLIDNIQQWMNDTDARVQHLSDQVFKIDKRVLALKTVREMPKLFQISLSPLAGNFWGTQVAEQY